MKTSSNKSIIDAARTLFAARGYDGVSMDAIAAAAGVAKATVYAHFDSKETLFSTVVRSYLAELPTPRGVVTTGPVPLRERLLAVAHKLLALGTGPLMQNLHRVLCDTDNAVCVPGDDLWDAHFQPYHVAVRRWLEAERDSGALTIDDSEAAATHFLSLVAGEPMVRLFLGGSRWLSAADSSRHVARAVDAFLRAYATPDRPTHGHATHNADVPGSRTA